MCILIWFNIYIHFIYPHKFYLAVKCPPGQVFEECGDECYRTCDDMQSNEICKSSCVEGCRCPLGQALDESNECIPIGLCPCTYKGLKFNPGYKEVRPSSKHLELWYKKYFKF